MLTFRKISLLATVALLSVASSCNGNATEPNRSSTAQTQLSPETPTTIEQSVSTTARVNSAALCESLETSVGGTVATSQLQEASGLVASATHQDVFWSHNDSGSETGIFAFNQKGEDLGFYPLAIEGIDIEAISLHDGKIYLADIGDNINSSQRRDSVFIYAFDEPSPGSTSNQIEAITTYELRYPTGSTDAEAFFIDPLSGAFVIIEKAFGISFTNGFGAKASNATIYMAKPDAQSVTVLTEVGELNVEALEKLSTAPLPEGQAKDYGVTGAVTAADISPDGKIIALRTYATVWLYDRDPQQSIAATLASQPCEAPSALEPQGEAIALRTTASGRYGFVTISEGQNVPIHYAQTRN